VRRLPGLIRARFRAGIAGLAVFALLALVVGACGTSGSGAQAADDRIRVVATTTILADLVRQVGGDRVTVESLVPKGGEAHTFDPTPSDVRRVVEADLVVRNGLGLDDWLLNLIQNAGATAPDIALGEGLPGAAYIQDGGQVNPHLWLDVAYARSYAARIAGELERLDPGHAAEIKASAAAYDARLAALDDDIRTRLASIPEADRTVISFHDAFPYFARAYGLTVDGTVVDAPGQDPSAAQVEALIGQIRAKGVKAILAEAQFSDKLVRAIADETGATVVSDLYTDSVGDAPIDTYERAMRWDTDRLLQVLAGG
jgi:ABC-type Zn uptake system ZnuABC Zn-binding protein ZnuA